MARRWYRYWPLAVAALALLARVVPTPRTIDDAFITFRYARNLLGGLGFVYNPGEHVLGTTTPLYTLLMAGVAAATRSGNYPWIALWVNALADAATCLVLMRLGERLGRQRAVGVALGLLWAVAPMSVTFAVGGMETSVFVLLLVVSAALYLAGRTRWAAFTSALMLLTRPDSAALVGPVVLDLVWRRWRARKPPWVEAGIFLATLAPWVVFATLYFGSPLPHSIAAKSLAYRLPPGSALVRLLQHFATPFFEYLVFPNSIVLIACLTVYLALYTTGGLAAIRRDARVWPVVLYPLLYSAAFAIANPLIFRWYLAPPLPFYFLFVLLGLAQLAEALKPTRGSGPVACAASLMSRLMLPTACLGFLALSLNAWSLRPDHGPKWPAPEMAWHQIELLYTRVGQELAPHVTAQTVIAAGDVGALGYYSNARILDTVGLMSPEASAYYPLDPALYVITYAVPPQLILDYQPDYVVLMEVYGRNGLFTDPRFRTEYELSQKIPSDVFGSDGMLVWARRSTADAAYHSRCGAPRHVAARIRSAATLNDAPLGNRRNVRAASP
jgi:hypothetical protein